MSVIENVKAHPVLFGGVALGAIVLVIVMSRSGGVESVSGAGSSPVAGASDLQAMQLAANAQAQQSQLAYQARSEEIAGSVELANIQSQTSVTVANIAAAVQSLAIGKQAESTNLANTLAADVENNRTAAQTEQYRLNQHYTFATTQAVANALVQQGAQSLERDRMSADLIRHQITTAGNIEYQNAVNRAFGH